MNIVCTVAELLAYWLLSVSEQNKPYPSSNPEHHLALRLDRLSELLPGLHPSKLEKKLTTSTECWGMKVDCCNKNNSLDCCNKNNSCVLEYRRGMKDGYIVLYSVLNNVLSSVRCAHVVGKMKTLNDLAIHNIHSMWSLVFYTSQAFDFDAALLPS